MASTVAQLRQEIQQQLLQANQMLHLIQAEVREIKNLTSAGGAFMEQIMKSAAIIDQLERAQNVTVEVSTSGRPVVQILDAENHSMSSEQPDTFSDHSP